MINKNIEKIVCISATYNEEKYLYKLIQKLSKYCFKIIIIDDGSTDNTQKTIQKENIDIIINTSNLGKGASMSKGYRHVLNSNLSYRYVLLIDSDLQHDPDEIPKLLEALDKNNADMVIGTRNFLKSNMPLGRKIWNYTISLLHSILFGMKIRDSQSGYRLFTKDAYLNIFAEIKQDKYLIETEINIIANKLEIKVVEQSIKTIYQIEKLHKDKFIFLLKRMLSILIYILSTALINAAKKFKIYFAYSVIFISFCLYGYNVYLNTRPLFDTNKKIHYARDYVEANDWLKYNTPISSVVLTEWTEGHQVVLLSGRRVVATSKVYPTEANEVSARYVDLAQFFYSNNVNKIHEILDIHHVNYIFIRKSFDYGSSCKGIMRCNRNNIFLQSLIKGKMTSYPFINKQFENTNIIIYKYN